MITHIKPLLDKFLELIRQALPGYKVSDDAFSISISMEALNLLHTTAESLQGMNVIFGYTEFVSEFTSNYYDTIITGVYTNISNVFIEKLIKIESLTTTAKIEQEIIKKLIFLQTQCASTYKVILLLFSV